MTSSPRPFDSLYRHGFARVSVCVPKVKVAAPAFNAEQTLALARAAHDDHAALALFPEMGLSAYSNEDLFHQDALLDATEAALDEIVQASNRLTPVLLVGAPLRLDSKLFNCAIIIHHGRVLGVVPKSYLPNYREFYEKRQFTAGFNAPWNEARVLGQQVPFGTDLIFEASDLPGFNLFAEICEDVWTPIPPSTWGALAGATVLANLSASNIVIGKAAYRRALCAGQSGKCVAAYLYTAAGLGESTTDLQDGHAARFTRMRICSRNPNAFCDREQHIPADIDLDRLRQERMRLSSFNDAVGQYRQQIVGFRRIRFELGVPNEAVPLRRSVERFPYVPHDPHQWDERCFETYNIQVNGLEQRLRAASIKKVVIGISGGLDSTQALIVCCRTMDRLGLPRGNVLAFTMPGFATSDKTKANALAAHETAGRHRRRDRYPKVVCQQMLKEIGHPFSRGEPVHDLNFENVQAGERTSHLIHWRTMLRRPSSSAPAIYPSWPSAGTPTASAIRCRITTSTPRSPRRSCSI